MVVTTVSPSFTLLCLPQLTAHSGELCDTLANEPGQLPVVLGALQAGLMSPNRGVAMHACSFLRAVAYVAALACLLLRPCSVCSHWVFFVC